MNTTQQVEALILAYEACRNAEQVLGAAVSGLREACVRISAVAVDMAGETAPDPAPEPEPAPCTTYQERLERQMAGRTACATPRKTVDSAAKLLDESDKLVAYRNQV